MTPAELRAILAELDWSQVALARRLAAAGGAPVAATTIWRYMAGKTAIPPGVAAYLRLACKAAQRGIKV
jgi:transcriptional regulator with XRE-family HTH domain